MSLMNTRYFIWYINNSDIYVTHNHTQITCCIKKLGKHPKLNPFMAVKTKLAILILSLIWLIQYSWLIHIGYGIMPTRMLEASVQNEGTNGFIVGQWAILGINRGVWNRPYWTTPYPVLYHSMDMRVHSFLCDVMCKCLERKSRSRLIKRMSYTTL